MGQCAECHDAYLRDYHRGYKKRNRDRLNEYERERRRENSDELNRRRRELRAANRDEELRKRREYRAANAGRIRDVERARVQRKRDKAAAERERFLEENAIEIEVARILATRHRKAVARERQRERYWSDIDASRKSNREKMRYYLDRNRNARIAKALRGRVRDTMKGSLKSARTMDLLGCSMDFFMAYMETQFRSGMSWENYGRYGWHIDHIRPCASFDLGIAEEQRECFHWSNMQPLWAEENIKKGASEVGGRCAVMTIITFPVDTSPAPVIRCAVCCCDAVTLR